MLGRLCVVVVEGVVRREELLLQRRVFGRERLAVVVLREEGARHALIVMIEVAGDLRVRRVAGVGRGRSHGPQGRQRRLALVRPRGRRRRELAGREPGAAGVVGGHQRRTRGVLLRREEVELRLVGREREQVGGGEGADVLVVVLRGGRRGEDVLFCLPLLLGGVLSVWTILMSDEGRGKQRRHSLRCL